MSYPNQNSPVFNYKSNWNTAFTVVNAESGYWSSGGSVLQYISSNHIVLNDGVVTQNFYVSGNLTVQGNLTAQGTTTFVNTNVSTVTALSGNFANLYVGSLTANELINEKLDSVFNTVKSFSGVWDESEYLLPIQASSGSWNSVYTTTRTNSAGWESTETKMYASSANWDSTYSTVNSLSDTWEESAFITPLQNASGSWDSTYSTVNAISSNAVSVYTSTSQTSSNWNSTYSTVSTFSATWGTGGSVNLGQIPSLSSNWNNTYNQFSSNSANYLTISFVEGKYLPLSGGIINGDLTINGGLTAFGDITYLDTVVTVTSSLSVVNAGTGPALTIRQTGSQPIAQFFDNESGNALYIADNGKVGIGTAIPDSELFVQGTTYVEEIKEKVTLSAFSAVGTINFDLKDQSVLFLTLSSSGNWTINFRGNSSTTLNNTMTAGQSFTCVTIVSTATTTYYNSAVQIDGSAVTPRYLNGLTPQAVISQHNCLQNYAYTIIKRGEARFEILASVNEYY